MTAGAVPVRIRDAMPADAQAIASIHIDVWRTTYRGHFPDVALDALDLERWTKRGEQRLREMPPKEICLVAEREGVVIGFAMAGRREFDAARHDAEVYAIAGARITETSYVWDDTSALRSRSAGGSGGKTQRM